MDPEWCLILRSQKIGAGCGSGGWFGVGLCLGGAFDWTAWWIVPHWHFTCVFTRSARKDWLLARRHEKREQAPALHRNVPPLHLQSGGLPPLCGALRGLVKIKSDGGAGCRAKDPGAIFKP